MWRWLNSLPRAVRQQFHSPGASAGICVEDLHENELNKKKSKDYKQVVNYCRYRYRYEKKGNNGGKEGPNPENIDFWKLLHGKHSVFEAFGLGGAIALCVELTRYNSIGKYQRNEEESRKGYLLRIANSIHKLGGSSFCPVYHLNPGEKIEDGYRQLQNEAIQISESLDVEKHEGTDQAEETKPNLYFGAVGASSKSFSEEKRFTFYDEDSEPQPRLSKQSKSEKDILKPDSKQKLQTNSNIKADTSIPVVSIEEAFTEFEDICKKYTGVGKGIMGNQAAMLGKMKSAASLWEEAVSLGHSKSVYNLALCYEQGKGVQQNWAEAVHLYKLAVKEGHIQAMYNLGIMYMDGTKHTPQDTHRAIELLTSAADLGLVQAQKYLGVYYSEDCVEQPEKAAHYMKMAADQQDAESQYFMAMFYEHGYGVEENPCKAAYLYNKAAESGHKDALYSLALFHLDGLGGLPQDTHCAKRLLKQSADLGNIHAGYKLEELDKISTIHIKPDAETYHSEGKKSISDSPFILQMNSSVSTPCLSELVRNSFKQVKDRILYDPLSESGTVSQIYSQLMIPRGLTLMPSMTQLSDTSGSSCENTDSDSGVIFQIGREFDSTDDDDDVNDEEFLDDFVEFGERKENESMNSRFGHSASLPDMFLIASF